MGTEPRSSVEIISSIPGRVRLRFAGRSAHPGWLLACADRLTALPGVRNVRVAAEAHSVIVRYGTAKSRRNSELGTITAAVDEMLRHPPSPAEIADRHALLASGAPRRHHHLARSHPGSALHAAVTHTEKGLPHLLMSTLAVTVAAIEGLPLLLVGGALALAAAPVASHALVSLRKRKVETVQLDFANVALLVAVGDFLAAGQITWVLSLSEFLRSQKIQHVSRALSGLMLGEAIGKDKQGMEIARIIAATPPAHARVENQVSTIGDRLAGPLLGVGGGVLLLTGDPFRMTAVLRYTDLASDFRIAAPGAVLSTMIRAARSDIFLRGGRVMEKLVQVDTVVFEAGFACPPSASFRDLVRALRKRGVRRIVLLTEATPGKRPRLAPKTGEEDVEIVAQPKTEFVRALHRHGYKVAVVGDGAHGSTAVTRADVGVVVRPGCDMAHQHGDVILMNGDLLTLPLAIDLAQQTITLLQQNVHMVAWPTAMGVTLSALGLTSPLLSTIINHGTGAIAGFNSLRPLFYRPAPNTDVAALPAPVVDPGNIPALAKKMSPGAKKPLTSA